MNSIVYMYLKPRQLVNSSTCQLTEDIKQMKLIKRIAFGSAALLIVMMMIATVLEKLQGTETAWAAIYGSPLFTAIWTVMAICASVYLISRKLQRNFFTFLLHLSFLVILAGALTTRLSGKQGVIHLRMDEASSSAFTTSGQDEEPLPFHIQLHDFHIDYYKGSFAPMDFTSQLLITDNGTQTEGEVSMNRIFTYRHYRFYQSAYDKDGKGTTLAVSYDPWGIGITYTGYALLLLSILGFFFQKDSMFRKLLRHPALQRKAAMLLGIVLFSSAACMASGQPKHLSRETASEIGNLYIYYHDRICPLQTLAKDFTVKLYGKPSYKGLTAEQVFTGWFFFYDDWKTEPIIRIKSKAIQQQLGIDRQYACLNDFFGTEGYKLKEDEKTTHAQFKRELNEANEKFNLISMTATGSILKIYPCRTEHNKTSWFAPVDDLPQDLPDDQWLFVRKNLGLLSEQIMKKNDAAVIELTGKIRKYQQKTAGEVLPDDTHFNAEKLYNRLDYTKPLAMGCLTVGILSFIFYCRRMSRPVCRKTRLNALLLMLLGIVSVYLLALISLRGLVSGHLPLSNGYETMQCMAFCATLLTFLFHRKFEAVIAFGYMLCGLALLVAMLGEANPPITRLMPVLASPLLSLHVVTIMIAYALTAFVMLNGIMALVLRYTHTDYYDAVVRLQIVSRLILYPAVFCLALGIFIGAVWANVSWGRYWGWDPKETWALITLLIYAAALHPASLPAFRRPMFFHWFAVIAFLSVLTTYFGVNFILGGIHSYAQI